MKTYFVCSDIHSFYTEWMQCLKQAGFKKNNPEHILIICGDIFDRGTQPLEIYKFLKALPKERRILIKGNHEYLLKELFDRKYSLYHDKHNGTEDTICYLSKQLTESQFDTETFKLLSEELSVNDYMDFIKQRDKDNIKRIKKIYNSKKIKEIIDWIFSDEWVNYYETEHYIFVHAWFPMIGKQGYSPDYNKLKYNLNWRNSTLEEWEEASWGFPVDYYKANCNQTGKTIVCGHWHTSDFWNELDYKNKPSKQLSIHESNIYKSEQNPDLIGLDACTVLSKRVNILVLKENEL